MTAHDRRSILVVCILFSLSASLAVAGEPVTQGAPGGKIDYVAKLNELVKKGSDESLNAEPFYEKAFQLCVEPPASVEIRSWPSDLSEEQRLAWKQCVEANAEALRQLRLGTERASYWFQYRGSSLWDNEGLRDISKPRVLFFALTLRTKFEAAQGDMKNAIEDLLTTYRFGLDMKKRLLAWEQLMGIAILGGTWRTGFEILDRVPVDAGLLESLQKRLTALSRDQDLLIDLRYNEITQLDGIQKVYGNWPEKRDPKVIGDEIKQPALAVMAFQLSERKGARVTPAQVRSGMFNHSRAELMQLVREGQAYYEPLMSQTPFQWNRAGVDVDTKWKDFTGGNLVLEIMTPAAQRMAELSFRCRAMRDALLSVLALLRYKQDKAAFPEDWEELVRAGCLPEEPPDPYSEWPLVYRRARGGFVLYSVGADFKDNNGTHSPKWGAEWPGGDYVFWPVPKQ
jgi:hypothetical protein